LFCYLCHIQNAEITGDNKADKDTLIEALLLEHDELYQELSKLRQPSGGALEHYETIISEKDNKIRQLTDQLA